MSLACNLHGIPGDRRARYAELTSRLRTSVREKRELPDGYALLVDSSFADLEEWISLERLCCPFLEFDWRPPYLSLKGPEGAKELIDTELRLQPPIS